MKAVFLDRDGVVVEDKHYQFKTSDMRILDGVPEAIARLNKAGYLVVIISNQSGVARGYFTEKDVRAFNEHLVAELKTRGARIDAVYYCPHHPTKAKVEKYRVDCDCRKPKPGMLIKAAKEHDIVLSGSWMVGDKDSDVQAGKSAGCRTICIGEGKSAADATAPDIRGAVDIILSKG
jgi:D-glycero-D-manno-heptose 1,7-bisphosphate phosphatase